MAVIKELIRKESDGTLSFGNYEFDTKQKLSDFEFEGDLYKVKTFKEITKLEKNGLFVYESVPGTVVTGLKVTEDEMMFSVEGLEDASITLELEPETEYKVYVDDTNIGKMKTNLGGKLILSLEINAGQISKIRVVKL
ncbi:MAG: endosialidase [Clostridiaceae bacterium]|nr:endosialidase [Clostridiaceae bacterium]